LSSGRARLRRLYRRRAPTLSPAMLLLLAVVPGALGLLLARRA